jgi:hypothetical protein
MSDINFDCPKCGQNLDAPADLAGLFIECPSCNAIIKVPPVSGAPAPGAAEAAARRSELRPPPPKPATEEKGSTMRIEVPQEFRLPPAPQRKIIIKRTEP